MLAAALAGEQVNLREPLQIIVAAHDMLARRTDGEAEWTQLTLIEDAAMQIAGSLTQLVEVLRLQKAPTGGHLEPIPLHPILWDRA